MSNFQCSICGNNLSDLEAFTFKVAGEIRIYCESHYLSRNDVIWDSVENALESIQEACGFDPVGNASGYFLNNEISDQVESIFSNYIDFELNQNVQADSLIGKVIETFETGGELHFLENYLTGYLSGLEATASMDTRLFSNMLFCQIGDLARGSACKMEFKPLADFFTATELQVIAANSDKLGKALEDYLLGN